jgi:ubiquitin-protein ligase
MTGFMDIAPQTKRRLFKDIERAQEKLMRSQKIWYMFDEANMCKGKALILGPPGTPYESCFLVFDFLFPVDYPFSPPKVSFLTSDGYTRLHPNLYVEGKVCLSILGTFSGPSWSASQSLSSVLLSILALLDKNPLTHEPAFERGSLNDPKHSDYAETVEHNLVRLTMQTIKSFENTSSLQNHLWADFEDIVREQLPTIKKELQDKITAKAAFPEKIWTNSVYGKQHRSFWKQMARDFCAGAAA